MGKYNEELRAWFHNGHESSVKYKMSTARIDEPYFGFGDYGGAILGLHMSLHSDDGDSLFHLYDNDDIKQLLNQFHVVKVQDLEGKIVEIFKPDSFHVAGFRVARHLLASR